MTRLLEMYPVYKDVNRESLIDAIGKKYPVYLEQPDFKEEFDALQALNKSVQETPTPAPVVAPEPSVPASEAFGQLFSRSPTATTEIPATTASPLTEGAAQQDILRTGVSRETAVLGDSSTKSILEPFGLSFPKPKIHADDSDRLKLAKATATAISSGLESILSEQGLQDLALGFASKAPSLVFGTLGAVGTVRGTTDALAAKTPEDLGRAIGETFLNAGMAGLAAKHGLFPKTPEALAPRTVEAAKAVVETTAPKVEAVEVALPEVGKSEVATMTRQQWNTAMETAFREYSIAHSKLRAFEAGAQKTPEEFSRLVSEAARAEEALQKVNESFPRTPPPEPPKKAPPTAPPADVAEVATGPGAVGMGAATPSQFPVAPGPVGRAIEASASKLQKVRSTIARLWETRETRDVMAYTKDAGESAAGLFSREMRNDIRQPLKRQFAKETPLAEEALSFAREAGMDENILRSDRDKIASSKYASETWARKAVDAIDYALYNLPKLQAANKRYGQIVDAQLDVENANGIATLKRDNYVMHAQDVEFGETFLSGGTGEPVGFKKVRTFDKFADSISAGTDPKTLNAVDLLEHRVKIGQQLINNRAWTQNLKSLPDPKTKNTVATDPQTVTRADGSTYQEAPSGYHLEHLGNQSISILNGYEGIFHSLTDPSFFHRNMAGRAFVQANAAGKSINLLLDTFHLGRVAFWESLVKSLGVSTFKAPWPSYKKGMTLLDFSTNEILTMAKKGEIPKEWANTLISNKIDLTGLVSEGYNVGRISDMLYQEWIHHIPVFGRFNKFLFEKFQRGAMAEVGLLEVQRLRNARPELTERQVYRQVAKDLNTRFGNIGRQGWFKSRTAQDLSRTIALAPQWNEGLIKSEVGAVTQTARAIKDMAQGKRIYAGVMARSVGGMALAQFAANQILNLYTRGHPTWDNPEEGYGAKISAWIPDKVGKGPGFFLHPFGLAAETTHLILDKFEKTGDFASTVLQYSKSRASAAMRPILVFITQRDVLGRNLKPGTVFGEMAKSAIPVPIGAGAVTAAAKEVVTGQPSETFTGQYQKQAMASFGVKTDQAPSPEQRIRALARHFNTEKGIESNAQFYAGDYQDFTKALRIGNTADAQKALDVLLTKKTIPAIIQHFINWPLHPFTGQRMREAQFKKTLSAEQLTQYDAAVAERKRVASLARELARKALKP